MAKISKIELNLSQKIANPFKTTRKSTTNPILKNPFSYTDFEGNTLDVSTFADVFEGSKAKTGKLKMISSSVMGSMTKIHNSITEPIVKFVKRIKTLAVDAWDYAKNTNVEIAGLKTISEKWNNAKNSVINNSAIGGFISDTKSILNRDITDIGRDLSEKWCATIKSIKPHRISSDMPVAELRELWTKENDLIEAGKKVA